MTAKTQKDLKIWPIIYSNKTLSTRIFGSPYPLAFSGKGDLESSPFDTVRPEPVLRLRSGHSDEKEPLSLSLAKGAQDRIQVEELRPGSSPGLHSHE